MAYVYGCTVEDVKIFVQLVSGQSRKLHCRYGTCGCAVISCSWIQEPTWAERQVAARVILGMDVHEGRLH